MELRSYQAVAIARLRDAARRGVKRMMLQMPTAAGKTRIAAEIVNGAREKQKRVLFTVPAISLVDQTMEMFAAEGIKDVGVIQADHILTNWKQPIQIASVQTLMKRIIPQADVVIRDEAHRLFKFDVGWMNLATWLDVPFIGLSATPWTRGLGKHYAELIVGATTAQLITDGWLSGFKVFAPSHPDLKDVKVARGDYVEADLSKAMNREPLTADAVETWQKLADNRPTICFAVDCAHAQALQNKFKDAGISAGYMDAHTKLRERKVMREDFESGAVKVICNVDVMGIGVDWPGIACVSYCRPTRSEIRYVQNIGRGLRKHPGKDHLLILDHSDTTLRLGFVSDIHHEVLHGGKERLTVAHQTPLPVECKGCHMLRPRGSKCPHCGLGAEHHERQSTVEHREGELVEYAALPAYKGKREKFTAADKQQFMAELRGYCMEKRFSSSLATRMYKFKFGHGPNGYANALPITPSLAMRRWIRHFWIAYHAAKQKQTDWEKTIAQHEKI